MDCYEIVKSIGSGSFGQVYLARHRREEKLYVIKRIKIRDMSQKDKENTENEVRLLQKLRHPNIVAYKDSYLDREQYLNIVMIHCEGGDIYQKIRIKKTFPETQILDWFAQMTLALYYLHEQKILHRDLKTQNIFLKNGRVRLGDFGIAKVLDSTRDLANTCIGTPYYMSPELFKYKPYSYKSDVWALGCCLYEMCNLRHAFDAQSMNGLALKILKGSFPPISPSYSKGLRDLINKMLNTNPKMRPTIHDIIHKPLIKMRIMFYMLEVLSETAADLDDMYVDTLWEQAEKIGVLPLIQHHQRQMQKGVTIQDIKNDLEKGGRGEQRLLLQIQEAEAQKLKLLKKEQQEKKKLEEEIRRLEQKKQTVKAAPQETKVEGRSESRFENKPEATQSVHKVENQKLSQRRVSLERDKKSADLRYKQKERSLSLEKERLRQHDDSLLNAKEKVLQLKQKKADDQKQRWEREFQQIQQENLGSRRKAVEQKQAQYRPSVGNNMKLQEEFEMSDDSDLVNPIQEIENEDEYEEDNFPEASNVLPAIEVKIDLMKTKLKEKTFKINEIQQSLMQSRQFKEQHLRALETGQPVMNQDIEFDNEDQEVDELEEEEFEEEEEQKPQNSTVAKIQDRIKLLRHRCEAGLGNNLSEQAQLLVKQSSKSNGDIRKQLIELLGEEHIGYWQLFDQILYMEDMLLKF